MKKVVFVLCILLISKSMVFAEETVNRTMNFGYYLPSMSNVSGKDVKISLDFWGKEMGDRVKMKLVNTYYKDIRKLKKDIKDKKIDIVSASPLVFAKEFEKGTFQNGFVADSKNSESKNKLVLLVQTNSDIKGYKDLKNRKIARIQNNDIQELYLNTELQKIAKKNSDQFFKKNIFVKQYSKAVLKLFFKKVDAALVSEEAFELAAELNPQIKKRLHVIESKSLNMGSISLFLSDVSDERIKLFKDIAFKIHESERGKQILTVFKSDFIVESNVSDVEKVKELYNKYLALKK